MPKVAMPKIPKVPYGWKLVVIAIIFIGCAVAVHYSASAIETFTMDDLDKKVDSATGMLVFVMDGCGYCDELKRNVLDRLTKEGEQNNFLVVKRGGDKENKIIDAWGVQGFPTIYFLKNGQKQRPPGSGSKGEYEGPRDYETIKKELKTVVQGF